MTQEEKIEHLAKAVMTLSELGDGKTAYVLNEIRLEMKSQLELPDGLEEEIDKKWRECYPIDEGMGDEKAILVSEQFHQIARHFAEWGCKNAK